MPPPSGRATQTPADGTVTRMPDPDDQTSPQPSRWRKRPQPPQNNPADQGTPLDNSVISTPLPPAPPPDDRTERLVPNPSDTENNPPVPGTSKQAQPQGQPVAGGWVKMGSATLQALDRFNAVRKKNCVFGRVPEPQAGSASLDIVVGVHFGIRPPDKWLVLAFLRSLTINAPTRPRSTVGWFGLHLICR